MARKKLPSLQVLTGIASRLSWRAAAVLALASYVGFHYVATLPPLPDSAAGGQALGGSVDQQLFRLAFEYIIPIVFIVGISASSFLAYRRKSELHTQLARDALQGMGPSEFQKVVAKAFGRLGYQILPRDGDNPDSNDSLVLYKGKDKFLVLCKYWKEARVEEGMVRELYGVIVDERAVGGFVVASGNLADEARSFAEERCIKVVSAQLLWQMVNEPRSSAAKPKSKAKVAVPSCPECGSRMVRGTLRKGNMAGAKFWRCSSYPACRGIRARLPGG